MKRTLYVLLTVSIVLPLVFAAPVVAQEENHKRAEQAIKARAWDEAIRFATASAEEYPDWFWGHYYLGKAWLGKGDFARAQASLGEALTYAANADEKFLGGFDLTLVHYRSGDYAAVIKSAAELERNKESRYAAAAREKLAIMTGFSHFELGAYPQALVAFKPVIDAGSDNADVLRAVAKSYTETDQGARATETIRRVVQADPKDLAAHKILVKSYLNARQFRQALDAVDAAIGIEARDWELYQLKGWASSAVKDHKGAVAAFRNALELHSDPALHRDLAVALTNTGEWLEATRHFDAAKQAYADDAGFMIQWGYSWYQYVPPDAEKYKGTAEEPNYRMALDNAARILAGARALQGGENTSLALLLEGVENKRERLDKGAVRAVTVEYSIDPDTGAIIAKEIDPTKQ